MQVNFYFNATFYRTYQIEPTDYLLKTPLSLKIINKLIKKHLTVVNQKMFLVVNQKMFFIEQL